MRQEIKAKWENSKRRYGCPIWKSENNTKFGYDYKLEKWVHLKNSVSMDSIDEKGIQAWMIQLQYPHLQHRVQMRNYHLLFSTEDE